MEANYAVKPGLATIMVPLLALIQGGPAEAAARKKTRTDGERPEDVLLAPPVAHNVALHLLHLRAHAYVVSHWAVDSDRAVKLITKALAIMSAAFHLKWFKPVKFSHFIGNAMIGAGSKACEGSTMGRSDAALPE